VQAERSSRDQEGPDILKLRDRGRLLVRWAFIDPQAAWGAVVPPFVILFISWHFPFAPEFRVRIAGFLVTFAGVWLVVKGILDLQRLFGVTQIRNRILAWLKRFPLIFLPPTPIDLHMQATIGGLSSAGGLQVRVGAGTHATLEQRVTVLEQNLQLTENRITEIETELTAQIRELQFQVETERRSREKEEHALRKQVEQVSVGGADFELMGAAWVIIGSAFATFPVEIASWLFAF
jgi:hypothetical protein